MLPLRGKSKDKGKQLSPLEAKKRALAEQQAKLNQEIQKREKLISEAPKLAEEAARKRREELLQRKSRSEARFGSPMALRDPRYGFEAHTARPEPRLRKDRNQGMITFFFLCIVLAAVMFWFYTKVIQGG